MRRAAYGALAFLGLCGLAQAQSSVTLYGRVAATYDHVNNIASPDGLSGNGSVSRIGGNEWGTSMLGFTGTEDLGGGLAAVFKLEGGFDLSKGDFSMFNRRSYVGLSSPTWGTVLFGKNLFISNDLWDMDPTGQQTIGSATLVRGRNWPGANNMIEYRSPKWGGFSFGAQTGLGEQVGSMRKGRRDGVSATYQNDWLFVRGIYDVVRDENGQYSSLYEASKEATLGTVLTFNDLKLYGAYQQLSAPQAALGAPSKAKHGWLGASYTFGPATVLGTVYRVKENTGDSANLYVLGANYNLSKRTVLTATVGRVSNKGNADFSVQTGDLGPLPGRAQSGYYLGMAHSF